MATKKPVRRMPTQNTEKPARSLMDNQDKRKGDSTAKDKVMVTFWVTPEKKAAMKEYAAEHEMTVSRLIVEGVNMRMAQ